MIEVQRFGTLPVTCHAWNKDRNEVAVSISSSDVSVYERKGDRWPCTDVLTQHDLRVTSIDWAPNTNRIVTCSEDRNAYVWTKVDGVWKPALVLLRINRAATSVKWSPLETKFAIGCGARLISICYFEEANDWWVSKHIKKPIRSTVTCIDWHPNNVLVACGSTDFRTRVFSAYVKEVEKKPSPTPWGIKMPLGNLMAEFPNSGWVHCVNFSSDGNMLAWVCHDSSITVYDTENGTLRPVCLSTVHLPYLTCSWVSDNAIVAAGFDCCPMLFSYNKSNLQFVCKLDKSQKKEVDGFSAMRKFRDMDKRAIVEDNNKDDTVLHTLHQNAITSLSIFRGTKSSASEFCTTGMDGRLAIWKLESLDELMGNLRIV